MSKKDTERVSDRKKYNLYLSEKIIDKLQAYCLISKRKKNVVIEELIAKLIDYCKATGRVDI